MTNLEAPLPGLQLDVESLRTLIAVLDHGGMTRAAERLGVSQSAVSWKIKRLEDRVGHPLLIRDGRELRPTRETRTLLQDARQIVELHDRAAARLASTDLTGKVILGSNEEIDPRRMASLLGRFARTHPHATIEFVIEHSARLDEKVADGSIDVAILQVDDRTIRPTDTPLWTDELTWVTSAAYPYDLDEPGNLPLPLITFGELCFYRRLSEPLLDEADIPHTVAFSGWSTPGLIAAVAAGLGVGVIGTRYLAAEGIVPWSGAESLPPLPRVHQVVRTSPDESPDVAEALVDAILAELLDPAANV